MDSNQIFDLAAGLLPAEEAQAVEASLSADDRAELEAQRAVLAAIAAAPPVAMTDIERARLHRSVAAAVADSTRELDPVEIASPPPSRRARRSVVWLRWASAAAVAATFVGVVAVGSQLADDSSDNAADATAETFSATTTAGASDTTTTAADAFSLQGGSDPADGALESSPQGFGYQLLEAPTLFRAKEKSDLDEVAAWLKGPEVQDAGRDRALADEDVTVLPCYEVAMEDDDLDIAVPFIVDYPGPDGEHLTGIGYADAGTATTDPLIRVYDIVTCVPVVASTD